jgi:hypothetical protein
MSNILYDSDFDLWIEQTIQQLKDRQFEQLDVEHLIEELQDLGKSEKRALESNINGFVGSFTQAQDTRRCA